MAPSSPPSALEDGASRGDVLIRSLLSLPELRMRVLWLDDCIFTRPLSEMAEALNEVTERGQSTDERAREAMICIAIFLANKRDTGLVWALREEARRTARLGLERLVRERTDPPFVEVELEPHVPDYKAGRELTVGERRSLARRPTRLQIDRLLLDPHPLVLEQLFASPTITEDDVLRIATRRPTRVTALELLAQNPRWMARRRVRLSLILNPGTPHGLALPLVSTCPRDDLKLVYETANLSKTLRSVAHELYTRLPPVPPSVEHHEQQ